MRRALAEANAAPLMERNGRVRMAENVVLHLLLRVMAALALLVLAWKAVNVPLGLITAAYAVDVVLSWVTVLPVAKDSFDRGLVE